MLRKNAVVAVKVQRVGREVAEDFNYVYAKDLIILYIIIIMTIFITKFKFIITLEFTNILLKK